MAQTYSFAWTVIGAGPAGIATVGKLIDAGINPNKIGWIDPHFQAGDFGEKWGKVPANTFVASFLEFFSSSESFEFSECKESFPILFQPGNSHCLIEEVAAVLQWITTRLIRKISKLQTTAFSLNFKESFWEIETQQGMVFTKNAVLCTGADPLSIPAPRHALIPLEVALHPEKLKKELKPHDRIAIFGASHSAVLCLANTLNTSQNEVFHFFRGPHAYAQTPFEPGLRGFGAEWARKHLDQNPPKQLTRCLIEDPQFAEKFSECNRVIYAIGFGSRKLPSFPSQYEPSTGIIGYGLYGLGIGFPPVRFNPSNRRYSPVTLQAFSRELDLLLPLWFGYANRGPYPEFPWLS